MKHGTRSVPGEGAPVDSEMPTLLTCGFCFARHLTPRCPALSRHNIIAVLKMVIPVCGYSDRDHRIPCSALGTKCAWSAPWSKECRCDEHGIGAGWRDAIWADALRRVLGISDGSGDQK